jgi:hypothetical protein
MMADPQNEKLVHTVAHRYESLRLEDPTRDLYAVENPTLCQHKYIP